MLSAAIFCLLGMNFLGHIISQSEKKGNIFKEYFGGKDCNWWADVVSGAQAGGT